MFLSALGASLLRNLLTGKGINKAGKGWGRGINRACEGVLATRRGPGIVRAGYGNNKMDF